jgi:CheY-like chemotaxis protein
MVNSEWLLQIINDILDISKIESGKMELEKIPFDLHELFSACRTIITPKADEKGVDMRFYAEPSIGKKMLGDPVRLRQVLLNMLSNSVKFTNTGGVIKLSATISEKSANGITVLFKVTDSGIGMTPEQIAKIAQPFVQAEAGTTRKYGGTGLGLAISKNLVKLMGGNLNIESTLGIGSKFSFEITFDTKDILAGIYDEETIISDIIEKPDLDGEVLVCEDNNMNQQMICSHLERVGLRPTIVENGLAGLEMVLRRLNKDEKPFDLIFMDIFMPVMDGIEAATKISQLGTGTPIVALTANVMASDKELYLKSGMNDCVGKPFVSQELWRCLLKYLKPVELKSEIVDEDKLADEKLLTMMKINFVTDHQSTYKKITSAIAEGDIKLAHRIAHSLKGNAGMLGKAALQKASADVENLLKDERNLVTPKAMSTLETELRAVLDELALSLNAVFSGKPAQPVAAPSLDQEKKRDLLAALRPLLESGNPGCLKHINSLRSISGTDKLIQQMENLDFEQATETLAELEVE